MLEVFLFYNRQNLIENIEKIVKELYDDSSGDEEECDEEECDEGCEEKNEIIFEEDIEESFKLSECKCALCTSLNNIKNKWETWKPETPIQEILQKHINNI
tara:strand:- start:194 stop:496 length:303 start_codon:yes stop_codon:yes gene_type:complete